MYRVTKRVEFDAAHRLYGYSGACARLHGHHYVVEVTVCGSVLNGLSMLLDFGDLRRAIDGFVAEWDHRTLLCTADRLFDSSDVENGELVAMGSGRNPTAESMAAELYFKLKDRLSGANGIKLLNVRLYETPDCWVDYCEDDK
jgi:6-pyruvoyltetrahydropterin/6-carboxytetrahydropterin synthase